MRSAVDLFSIRMMTRQLTGEKTKKIIMATNQALLKRVMEIIHFE